MCQHENLIVVGTWRTFDAGGFEFECGDCRVQVSVELPTSHLLVTPSFQEAVEMGRTKARLQLADQPADQSKSRRAVHRTVTRAKHLTGVTGLAKGPLAWYGRCRGCTWTCGPFKTDLAAEANCQQHRFEHMSERYAEGTSLVDRPSGAISQLSISEGGTHPAWLHQISDLNEVERLLEEWK